MMLGNKGDFKTTVQSIDSFKKQRVIFNVIFCFVTYFRVIFPRAAPLNNFL